LKFKNADSGLVSIITMDSLRLFPFPDGHFVYVNDMHRLIVPMLITPAMVSIFIADFVRVVKEFVDKYFDEIMVCLCGISLIVMVITFRGFADLFDRIIKKYTDKIRDLEKQNQDLSSALAGQEKAVRRISQRLLEQRQKMGHL
jgi:hypothetical protein